MYAITIVLVDGLRIATCARSSPNFDFGRTKINVGLNSLCNDFVNTLFDKISLKRDDRKT